MSKSDRKQLDLFRFDSKDIKFANFESLNELWKKYILSLLPKGETHSNLHAFHDVLLRADYVGATIKISNSRNEIQSETRFLNFHLL